MSALAPIMFESAYRQLSQIERAFVDAYISAIEKYAVRTGERLTSALNACPAPSHPKSRELLSMALVRAAISERIRDLSESMELNVYRTLKELRSMAYSSIGHYIEINDDGEPSFNLAGCTPEQLSAIKTIKIRERTDNKNDITTKEFEIVLHDKPAMLKDVMRYHGLLNDDTHWKTVVAEVNAENAAFETIDDAANLYAKMIGNG